MPRYSRHAASTRLRVFALQEALAGACENVIGYDSEADVLLVQKAVDREVFTQAQEFPRFVVYDFDDILDPWVMDCAQEVADLLTTDTQGRMSGLRKPCALVPDPIDYQPQAPWPPSDGAGAVWFGNYPNFESVRWMAEALLDAGIHCSAISDLSPERALLPIELVRWDYSSFTGELRKSSVAILSHGEADPHKSNNKMTAAITFGVPCIVSNSRAYAELARACGLEWAVVSTQRQVIEVYDRLQDRAERVAYLAAAQPYIWQNYSAQTVAGRLLATLEDACTNR